VENLPCAEHADTGKFRLKKRRKRKEKRRKEEKKGKMKFQGRCDVDCFME
jgi:hypothetical protein